MVCPLPRRCPPKAQNLFHAPPVITGNSDRITPTARADSRRCPGGRRGHGEPHRHPSRND